MNEMELWIFHERKALDFSVSLANTEPVYFVSNFNIEECTPMEGWSWDDTSVEGEGGTMLEAFRNWKQRWEAK